MDKVARFNCERMVYFICGPRRRRWPGTPQDMNVTEIYMLNVFADIFTFKGDIRGNWCPSLSEFP